jgi:hypothetical protein
MLYEYAVEPKAIASNWEACRYLSEKFGFHRARLLSEYPKKWLRLAIEAAAPLPDVEKKTVVEKLIQLKRNAGIHSGRGYDPAGGDWLTNAVAQQALKPFHAILASQNPDGHTFVLTTDKVDESDALMVAPRDVEVIREAPSLASEMALMLENARIVVFVDAYYDPFDARYQSTLRECLKLVKSANRCTNCDIHCLEERSASTTAIERSARAKFGKVIPAGITVTIYRWRKKAGGADFHARYLLTDRGGIRIDAGFSAEGGAETTDMMLMDFALSQEKRRAFERDANVYELVEPVLQIASTGYVKHV